VRWNIDESLVDLEPEAEANLWQGGNGKRCALAVGTVPAPTVKATFAAILRFDQIRLATIEWVRIAACPIRGARDLAGNGADAV
jgi:hypothetical protein